MGTIGQALSLVVRELTEKNHTQSLAFYRFWLETGRTYTQIPPDQIFDAIWDDRTTGSIEPRYGQIFNSRAHLHLRFANDVESDPILAPYNSGLQSHLCTRSLQEFSNNNLMAAYGRGGNTLTNFYADVNLIAHWANLGYMEEATIRNYVLQSLISHPTLYDHQAHALLILFKLSGATFEAYVDPPVVDRCFELLKIHSSSYHPDFGRYSESEAELKRRIQVRAPCIASGGRKTETKFRRVFRR